MFKISNVAIDSCSLKNSLANPVAGAFVSFEGWVRNHNEGKKVIALEYEAFELLAVTEAGKIIAEAKNRFDIIDCYAIHRVGKLNIGDLAVWIGVNSAHRDAAFEACSYIIDEIKLRLPIWKKEHYHNGDSGWVNCQACVSHNHNGFQSVEKFMINEDDYYSRQVILPEIGNDGQEKLKHSKVLVVGAGGLGSSALIYLASAGVGTLGICEFDKLETSNLHRQVIYDACEIGTSKSELASNRIKKLNPFVKTVIHSEKLDESNVMSILKQYDLVLDCTDNFKAKFLLNDAAVLLGIPLIQASIYQYEGQIALYDPSSQTACLRCLWPDIPEQSCVGSCAEVGVLGTIPGIFGTMQALEAIKLILDIPSEARNSMLLMDFMSYSMQKIKNIKSPDCKLCGNNPVIKEITSENYHRASEEEDETLSIMPSDPAIFTLIDIREPFEKQADVAAKFNFIEIPLSRFDIESPPLDKEPNYLLCCKRGVRSKKLARQLRELGFKNVYSLKTGINELIQKAELCKTER